MKTSHSGRHSRDVTAAVLLLLVWAVDHVLGQNSLQSLADRVQKAKDALNYVDDIASSGNCSSGTGNVLELQFDTSAWEAYTDPAIRTANYLAMLMAEHNNSLESFPDDILYNFVRNNVHGNTLIFGSAVALESDVLNASRHMLFCPYSSKTASGQLTTFDLALSYDYTSNGTEWYEEVRAKNFSGVQIAHDSVIYGRETAVIRTAPVANLSHGRWTSPYYDCGGGNIWMVTYSAPILGLGDEGVPVFKGVATIDLELTNIDINQCDSETDDQGGSLDVFRGSHNCQPTTKCVPIIGRGFQRSSYRCECLDGYYFPDTQASIPAFTGAEIDAVLSSLLVPSATSKFRCTKCQRGCDRCVDGTPCLYEYNLFGRVTVVVIVILLIVGYGALSFFTYKYRKETVMKTASPIFLQVMIAGATLMCLSVFMMFPEPSDLLCTLFVWPFHLGFVLLYGSLLLKTWRISVIFNTRKKVNLPDNVLLQRLLPLLGTMLVYLTCWSVLGQPEAILVTMADSKKFFSCPFDTWNFCILGIEACMLLVGVYLCFTVRKAPAHFNESKHITWSTYNAIILGIFIITLTQFLSTTEGPDVVYFLLMMQLQVFCTTALCLIFIPKLWALYHGTPLGGITGGGAGVGAATTVGTTIAGGAATRAGLKNVGVQVTWEDLGVVLPPAYSATPQGDVASSSAVRPSSGLRANQVSPFSPPPAAPPLSDMSSQPAALENTKQSDSAVNSVILSPKRLNVEEMV